MMPQRSQKPYQPRIRLNNQIREPELQVIDENGNKLGIMPTHEALQRALGLELDLVEVGPTAKPPLAKIMDYGKYIYQKERREKESKQKSKNNAQEVKTVKIGFRTESHDLMVRTNQVVKFLEKGFRVRIELTLRGREKGLAEIGYGKIETFIKTLPIEYAIESPIKRQPNGFSALIKNK